MNNNRIVKASAGTGKTFDIATQFIRLLVFSNGKVEPETILGLTFSRAAAQEIYEKILGRLRLAASSDAAASEERDKNLLGDIKKKQENGLPLSEDEQQALDFVPKGGWTAAMFSGILRRVIDAQGHGTVATIDSFIQRIVQKFPLETGFRKALSVLDDYGAKSAVAAAVAGVLSTTGGDDVLLSDFFVSQNGAAVRSGGGKLADLVGENASWLAFLRERPAAATWTAETMAAALGIERRPAKPDLSAVRVGEREIPFLGKIQDHVNAFDGTQDLYPRVEGKILRHFFEDPDSICFDFTHGNAKNNQYCFDCGREGAEALRAAVRYMAAVAINRRLDVAAAKLRLCKAVEDRYAAAVRRNGLLTFGDFTDSLAKAGGGMDGTGRRPDPATWLLDLQFRLDSEFSHWALDEFQDTSTAQWACLRPLVEEAVSQGAAGENRSVLAVGDLKQSIYRWRGGCNEPFESLEKTVRKNRGTVETRAKSWRYGANTAEFIDKVFGPENVGRSPADTLCPDAVGKWKDECWPEGGHKAVEGADGDYVEITGVSPPLPSDDDDDAPDDDAAVSAAMKKLHPALCDCVAELWDRHEEDRLAAEKSGKRFETDSIGILVRRNGDGVFLAEQLRKTTTPAGRRIPVVWEGTSGVLDSPVVCGVLELLRLAEHPGDDFAWHFVDGLFPVRETVFPEIDTRAGVSSAVSGMLSRRGLARTLETFATKLKAVAPSDCRTAMRLDRLVREGAKFEERPDAGGVDDFRKYLETVSDRDVAASPGVVRILTIHRAKGLTLDHVVVPVTSSDKLTEPKSGSRLDGDGWIVEGLDADLIAANPKTEAAWTAAANGHLLDELCTWYVALTRARKSTRVFFVDDGTGDKSRFCDLLRKPFPALVRAGGDTASAIRHAIGKTAPAFVTFPPPDKNGAAGTIPEPVVWKHGGKRVDVRHETPSTAARDHGGTGPDFVSNYFKPSENGGTSAGRNREKAQRYGTDEHAAFAEIERIDPDAPKDDRERKILGRGGAWREAFVLSADATVWRERSYEIFDQETNTWETGQFDRVVFQVKNGVRTAEIYDFKTNKRNDVESVEAYERRMREAYVQQMAAYRSAISRLCGIGPEHISSTLLLTATGTAVTME